MTTRRKNEISKNCAQVNDIIQSFLATSEGMEPANFLAALGTTLALTYLALAPNPDRGVFLTIVAKSYDIVFKSMEAEIKDRTSTVSQTLN